MIILHDAAIIKESKKPFPETEGRDERSPNKSHNLKSGFWAIVVICIKPKCTRERVQMPFPPGQKSAKTWGRARG